MRSLRAVDLSEADRTPRTNEMASIKLDLPAPLGPMTAVNEWNGPLQDVRHVAWRVSRGQERWG